MWVQLAQSVWSVDMPALAEFHFSFFSRARNRISRWRLHAKKCDCTFVEVRSEGEIVDVIMMLQEQGMSGWKGWIA
jgi:hypothetical protein